MSKTNEPKIYENNKILKQAFTKTLSSLQKALDRIIFMNILYSDGRSGNTAYPGMKYIVNLRGAKKDTTPVIFYGFENLERLKKNPDASILNSKNVFYIPIPFQISVLEETIKSTLNQKEDKSLLDEKSLKALAVGKIEWIMHDYDNGITWLSSPIDKIMNAGNNNSALEEGQKIIIDYGGDFISKKVKYYDSVRSLIEDSFKKNKKILKIPSILKKADENYKILYKEIENSKLYKKSIKIIVNCRQNIINSLQEIKNTLNEVILNGK